MLCVPPLPLCSEWTALHLDPTKHQKRYFHFVPIIIYHLLLNPSIRPAYSVFSTTKLKNIIICLPLVFWENSLKRHSLLVISKVGGSEKIQHCSIPKFPLCYRYMERRQRKEPSWNSRCYAHKLSTLPLLPSQAASLLRIGDYETCFYWIYIKHFQSLYLLPLMGQTKIHKLIAYLAGITPE